MAIYWCKRCGGEMKERPDRLYECLYCGSVQTYDEVFFDKKKTRANMNSSATSTEEIYRWGVVARKDGRYKDAAEIFSQISDYRNASALRLECLSHLEAEKKENRYARACSMMQEGNIHFARQAAELFGSLSGFRDSARKREECLVFIRQQQEALLPRRQRNLLFGSTGAFTSSGCKEPSSCRTMGLMV